MPTPNHIRIPGFLVTATLNSGEYGQVYRARRKRDDTPVILKVVDQHDQSLKAIARLKHEFDILNSFKDSALLKTHGLEHRGGLLLLILDDLGGVPMSERLCQRPDLKQVLNWFLDVARQLERLHRAGVIHKDINPSNMIVDRPGKSAMLIDFSISSKMTCELREQVGVLEGTLPYLSPEQTGRMNRSVDHRSDFYSFGASLYHAITGAPPFKTQDPSELIHCHIARNPQEPELTGAPAMVSKIIMRLMAKNAGDRYQSAAGLVFDLEKCLEGLNEDAIQPFELGQRDQVLEPRIPQQLYGRDTETALLTGVLDRVSKGANEVVILSGKPGAGKSSLIQEIRKPLAGMKGYFVSGKSDMHQRNIPYGSVIQSLRKLMRLVMTQDESQLNMLRARLCHGLGSQLQILGQVMPELLTVAGEKAQDQGSSDAVSENRFQLALYDLIRIFTGPDRVLVIFLDDLQWADSATLNWIRTLPQEPGVIGLMLIGSYRSREVEDAHPLVAVMDKLEESGVPFHRLRLRPLSQDVVTRLVCDTFHFNRDNATPLSSHIFAKTGGNPFFVHEYLKSLFEEELLYFDQKEGRWTWDLFALEQREHQGDVVDFLKRRIQALPEDTIVTLKRAACLGNRFELRRIAEAAGVSGKEAFTSLRPAINARLIVSDSDLDLLSGEPALSEHARVLFSFLHDQVQQASYALMDEDERLRVHLEIGRLMYKKRETIRREDALFEMVSHFNQGASIIEDTIEKVRLIRLNLDAGIMARSTGAYDPALGFLSAGMELLPEHGWRHHYGVAMELHIEMASCLLLCNDLAKGERLFADALSQARTVPEMARIYDQRTKLYTQKGLFAEALDVGLAGMELLGMPLPLMNDELAKETERLQGEIRIMMAGREPEDLLHEPSMQDELMRHALSQLIHLWAAAVNVNRNLMNLVILKIVELSLQNGHTPVSACGYVGYGALLGSSKGDYLEGERFGKLALDLCERTGNREQESMVFYFYGAFVHPWRHHFRECLPYLHRAYESGKQTGNHMWAALSGYQIIIQRIFKGDQLQSIMEQCRQVMDFLKSVGDEHTYEALRSTLHLLGLLTTKRESYSWSDTGFEDVTYLENIQRKLYIMALIHYYNTRSWSAFTFWDYEEAIKYSNEVRKFRSFSNGWPIVSVEGFYRGLFVAALADSSDEETRHAMRADLNERRNDIRAMAQRGPANFEHRYVLLEAEAAAIEGKLESAMDLFDRAIELAREGEFTHIEALACELAGLFFFRQNKRRIGLVYLRDAVFLYARWGAHGKVDQLQRKFPELVEPERDRGFSLTHSATAHNGAGLVDLNAILKAARVLSGEMQLKPLLEKLLKITIENVGAERGVLVMEEGGALQINVEGHSEKETIIVQHTSPMSTNDRVATPVVNYVFHSGEAVMLANASKEGQFTATPYILKNRPKSLLCLPLLSQGKNLGVLYFENNLIDGAFTRDKLEVLNMIAAEAAISIQNARLYTNLSEATESLKNSYEKLGEQNRTLEQKVDERTSELKDKNLQLKRSLERVQAMQQQVIQQEKLASLGALTAGIAHEIRNPLNFVNNFSDVSVEMLVELEELVGQTPQDEEEVSEILTSLRSNLRLITEHGRRADRIVNAMLRHSHDKNANVVETRDLNLIVDEYAKLAFHGSRAKKAKLPIHLDTDYGETPPILMAPQDFGRVIINIVDNACFAIKRRAESEGSSYVGRILIKTAHKGREVEVRIRDNGAGVPEDVLPEVFNPFFTTKPAGEGTGLGLSISHEIIVKGHSGRLQVHSVPNQFTEFVISLPLERTEK